MATCMKVPNRQLVASGGSLGDAKYINAILQAKDYMTSAIDRMQDSINELSSCTIASDPSASQRMQCLV